MSNGHISRIFRCLFLSKFNVITGGEDSNLALWCIQTGECLKRWKAHDGSPIWSLTRCQNRHVITGGGDGSLKRFSCDLKRSCLFHVKLDFEKNDYPKLVGLMKNDSKNILVLTHSGSLMKVDVEQEEEGEGFASSQIVLTDPELGNHAIMKHTSSYAYFATLTGKIKWLCLSTFQFRHHHQKKQCLFSNQ